MDFRQRISFQLSSGLGHYAYQAARFQASQLFLRTTKDRHLCCCCSVFWCFVLLRFVIVTFCFISFLFVAFSFFSFYSIFCFVMWRSISLRFFSIRLCVLFNFLSLSSNQTRKSYDIIIINTHLR